MSFKDKLKKIKSEIKSRYEYMRGDKGVLESDYEKIKQWQPDNEFAKADKEHSLAWGNLAWFLFCLTKFAAKDIKNGLNVALLNNTVIDKWEKNKKNIKTDRNDPEFKKFFKNLQKSHPRAAATLQLWMVYALMTLSVLGGGKIAQYKTSTKQVNTEKKKEDKRNINLNYNSFKEPLKEITPWLIVDLITKEGVQLLDVNDEKERKIYESVCRKKGLNPDDKPRLHKPYKDSNNKWTIGFGSTIFQDGTQVNEHTEPITDEEAYELARWHIEDYETYPMLYWFQVYDEKLCFKNANEAVGICSIFYNAANNLVENKREENNKNRFTMLRRYRDGEDKIPCGGYGPDVPKSLIIDCFEKYPITEPYSFGTAWLNHESAHEIANTLVNFCADGGGLYWRRWLEAGLITGDINPQDLLECPINGMADFHKYMGGYKKDNTTRKNALWEKIGEQWVPKTETYTSFKEWLKEPKTKDKKGNDGVVDRKKVKDFLPKDILGRLQKDSFNTELKIIKKPKKMAFNDGIMKIKAKQLKQENNVFYPFDNEYNA